MEREHKSGAARLGLLALGILLVAGGFFLACRDMARICRHGVYRCKDDRMIEEPATPDGEAVSMTGAGIGLIAEKHADIAQYMMVVPAAAAVQPEYLPEDAQIRDQSLDLARARSAMPDTLQWIDLLPLFRAHAGEKLYYATAPWLTGWGSRYAARTALQAMGKDLPPGKESCHLLSDSFCGYLGQEQPLPGRYLSPKKERIEIYVPDKEAAYYREDPETGAWSGSLYDASALDGPCPYDVFFGGERAVTVVHAATGNGETLLVVGDRTADSVVPHFVSSFETLVLMHPEDSSRTLESLVLAYQPGTILYLYGANVFLEDRNLPSALGIDTKKPRIRGR